MPICLSSCPFDRLSCGLHPARPGAGLSVRPSDISSDYLPFVLSSYLSVCPHQTCGAGLGSARLTDRLTALLRLPDPRRGLVEGYPLGPPSSAVLYGTRRTRRYLHLENIALDAVTAAYGSDRSAKPASVKAPEVRSRLCSTANRDPVS
jgi:hypothetical protein